MSRTKETAEGLVRNSSRSGMAAAALFTAARLSGQPAGYFFCLRAEDHGLCPISHGCFPVILALLAGSRHGIYRHEWTIGYYLAGLSSWLLLSSSMKRVRGCMLQSTATYILLPWPHRRIKYEYTVICWEQHWMKYGWFQLKLPCRVSSLCYRS